MRWEGKSILCRVAVFSIFLRPMIVAISIRASISSLDWNNGNLPARKKRRIIPADHTSIAIVERLTLLKGYMTLESESYLLSDLHI